jgi:hypothetical protein
MSAWWRTSEGQAKAFHKLVDKQVPFALVAQWFESSELFDFGEVTAGVLDAEAKRGEEAFQARLLRPPFDLCVFHCVLSVSRHDPAERKADITLILQTDQRGLIVSGFDRYERCKGGIAADFDANGHLGAWRGMTGLDPGMSTITMDMAIALCLILNTKGIRVEVDAPPPKVNEKRRKRGKSLLRRVTRVDVRHYIEAGKTADRGGHHASPVPHRRRGHLRREHTWRTMTRAAKWIPDCIVNVQSVEELKARERYAIKHD